MNTIVNSDGGVEVVVPAGETWKSGEVHQAADTRLGVVRGGADFVGDGVQKITLHCGRDLECQMPSGVAVVAGLKTAAVDIPSQTIVAANGTTDVAVVLYPQATVGQPVRFILN